MKQRRELYHKHRDTIRELLSDYEIKSATDLSDALKEIFPGAIEELLEAELDEHLGYKKTRNRSQSYDRPAQWETLPAMSK